jgi:hypothetical protein
LPDGRAAQRSDGRARGRGGGTLADPSPRPAAHNLTAFVEAADESKRRGGAQVKLSEVMKVAEGR